jgi:small-conductance mechanosensitive channel
MAQAERMKLIKRIIFWAVIIGALLALLMPAFLPTAHGQQGQPASPCQYLGGCLPGTDSFSNQDAGQGIANLILNAVYFLIFISGAVSIFFMVWGGYTMIVSDGSGDAYKKGLQTVTNAVIGLIVCIVSLAIVSVIVRVVPGLNISQDPAGSNSLSEYEICVAYGGGQACESRRR